MQKLSPAFFAVLAVATPVVPAITYADEAEMVRAEHVSYCFEYSKFKRDGACLPIPASTPPPLSNDMSKMCTTETRQFQRLQSFFAGSFVGHSTTSGWTTNVALAQASGRTDLAMCQKEIDEGQAAVNACVGGSKDYDKQVKCVQQVPAPECKRLADRCAKIDDELPY